MKPLAIEGIGVCAGGLPDWATARAILRGDVPYVESAPPRPTPVALPATERRRANDTARWALQVAAEAVQGLPASAVATLATIFVSADGDGDVLAQVLRDIAARPVALSPTTFHNSVYNAPAGYWSIAAQAPAASTSLCAGEASFAAGLLEAFAQVASTGEHVLLVACDLPFPAQCPLRTDAHAAFACALRLGPGDAGRTPTGWIEDMVLESGPADALPPNLARTFAGNGAGAALTLLSAVASGSGASVRLAYLDDRSLALRWTPCA